MGAVATLAVGGAAAVTTMATPAGATIVGWGNAAVKVAPPPSVEFHQAESDTEMRVFDEQQDVVLQQDLPVDITKDGNYFEVATLTPGVIPAGTSVRSHFMHCDNVGKVNEVILRGRVVMDSEIIGIAVQAAALDASDVLGAPGTVYPTGQSQRELELQGENDWVIELSDKRTVVLRCKTAIHADQVRIITRGTPPPPPAAIHLEKFTRVDKPGVAPCATLGKPRILKMQYTGDGPDGTKTTQPTDKFSVSGDPGDADPVYIVAYKDSKKTYFAGSVPLGGTFDVDSMVVGDSRLGSNTFIDVYASQGGALLQSIKFHTSCSQPIALGDQWGSAKLIGWTGEKGGTATLSTGFGEDADVPTGPEAAVGETIVWTYFVTNADTAPLDNIVVTDDNGTPGSPGDDFAATPVLSGGFNVGDTNTNNQLDPGEEWRFEAKGVAKEGQYANLGTVIGRAVPTGDQVTDTDPSHYFGVLKSGNLCPANDKPVKLVMRYTGDGPDGTSHSQDAGKVSVNGDPQDASPVYIVAFKDSSKRFFEGSVPLGGNYVLDPANFGESKFGSDTYIDVFASQGGALLQSIKFHTSCSQPLALGDQWGSARLVGYVGQKGSAGVTP